jgi:N6-adenosine-specific RNA methylase IME4
VATAPLTDLHAETFADTAATIPEVAGGHQVWLADPPWREQPYSWVTGSGRSVERHYGTMTIESLVAMGEHVRRKSAKDALLFLWVTWPYLEQCFDVAHAWGFRYSSNAWIWVKGATNGFVGVPQGLDLRYGRGHTTRKATEVCLLFRRGSGVKRLSGGVGDVILSWPEGRNSRKPIEQYRKIADFVGEASAVRCIELFARAPHPYQDAGWRVWGNEAKAK